MNRQLLMQQRAELTNEQINSAAEKICAQLSALPEVQQATTIGFYWPVRGEVDVRPLINAALLENKPCYLAALSENTERLLEFYHYTKDTVLTPNKFDIPEPTKDPTALITNDQLDVVLVPMLAFDQKNNRLGCGCGYYDSSFAFKQQNPSAKPYLIGVAYDWQQQDFPVQDWDIKMDKVITDK